MSETPAEEQTQGDPAAPVETAAPTTDTPAAAAMMPQFGGVAEAPKEAVPAVSAEGGYVAAMPLLTTGAYGKIVALLAKLLHEAGFPNDVHAGKAEPMLDDALMGVVKHFQQANGIDPSAPQDGAAPLVRKDHGGLVEAKTWEALLGAVHAIEDRYPMIDHAVAAALQAGVAA